MIKNFLNTEGHQNPNSGSKVTVILLKGWILPIGGASLGRVCTCSLRSRLVYVLKNLKEEEKGEGGSFPQELEVGCTFKLFINEHSLLLAL